MNKNKQIAKVFQDVLEHLATDDNNFSGYSHICLAIGATQNSRSSKVNAQRIIVSRLGMHDLGGYHTVHTWLEMMGVPKDELTHQRVQDHRAAWLKLLIEEFENKP